MTTLPELLHEAPLKVLLLETKRLITLKILDAADFPENPISLN